MLRIMSFSNNYVYQFSNNLIHHNFVAAFSVLIYFLSRDSKVTFADFEFYQLFFYLSKDSTVEAFR